MTSTEMTFSVRMQLNALDASRYRLFKQPHIDWALNEAQEVFIKSIVDPGRRQLSQVETTQRTIDDLREITVNQKPADAIQVSIFDETSYAGELPTDYRHYLRGYANIEKGKCSKRARLFLGRLDTEFEEDPFTRSSFEWEEVNFNLMSGGLIRVYTDKTYSVASVVMDYIRNPKYIHSAKSYAGGQYKTVDGNLLTGSQDCELADHAHPDIVALAVLILTNSLRVNDYSQKLAQLQNFYNQ
jgi:hypothetical protein